MICVAPSTTQLAIAFHLMVGLVDGIHQQAAGLVVHRPTSRPSRNTII